MFCLIITFATGMKVSCPVLEGQISIKDILSKDDHPDYIECSNELRECNTIEEKLLVLEKYGFTAGRRQE